MHYVLEAERDLAVANCRELLWLLKDLTPLDCIELQIGALAARTGRPRFIHGFNQPGASISVNPSADAALAFPGQPRHFLSR